jgi:hypothetical protein
MHLLFFWVAGFVSPDAVGLGAQAGLALNLVASRIGDLAVSIS